MNTDRRIEPALSVFMSNYNHGAFLPKALDALLSQTVLPGRIHIMDDASTDDSRTVIEDYRRRYPDLITTSFLQENRGCIANINAWLAEDKSEFIFIAAADDLIFPTLFEESIALLRLHPQAGVCSAQSRVLDELGRDLGRFHSWTPRRTAGFISPSAARRYLETHDSWFLGTTTVFRGATLRDLALDEELRGFADGFTCRVIALRDGACFIPRELAYWRKMRTGMAALDLADPASIFHVIDRASMLMSRRYAGLFSAEHIRRWKARWLFWGIYVALRLPPADARKQMQALTEALPSAQRVMLRTLSRLSFGRHYAVATLACFAVLRPRDVLPILWRSVTSALT